MISEQTLSHQQVDVEVIAEEGVQMPVYSTSGASGADVKAFIKENVVIAPGTCRLIPTGIKMAIPHGYEIQVRPRSGLSLKNQIIPLNTPGTIDADYRGEVGIILMNFGKEDFVVTPHMRIAQLVLAPVLQASFIAVRQLGTSVRGQGGFGHTGVN